MAEYPSGIANEPVTVYEGQASLTADGIGVVRPAKVQLSWLPTPSFTVELDLGNSDETNAQKVVIEDATIDINEPRCRLGVANLLWTGLSDFDALTSRIYRGRVTSQTHHDPSLASTVQVLLPNTPELMEPKDPKTMGNFGDNSGIIAAHGRVPVSLRWRDWTLDVDVVPAVPEASESLNAYGGYALRHLVSAKRVRKADISADDADALASSLGRVFSFVRGAWSEPPIAVGWHDGHRTWSLWRDGRIDPASSTSSWLPQDSAGSIRELLAGMLTLEEHETFGPAFATSLPLLIEARSHTEPATGIVLAQQALETLAWAVAVEERAMVSRDGFDRLPASDKLRLLLTLLQIPLTTPALLTERLPSRPAFKDGPHLLTDARNALVHRTRSDKAPWLPDLVGPIAALGIEYVEMSILSLCGYQGYYTSPVSARQVTVPWAPVKLRAPGLAND